MSNSESSDKAPLEAVPDLIASPDQTITVVATEDSRSESSTSATETAISSPKAIEATASTAENPSADAQETTDGPEVKLEPPTPELTAVSLPVVDEEKEEWTSCHMTWRGKVYDFRVGANDLVYDFRRLIQLSTDVPPERQKLVGLIKGSGKLSSDLDGTRFGNLETTKKGDVKFTMIGTPEDQSFVDPLPIPDIANDDFDVLYSALQQQTAGGRLTTALTPAQDPRNKRKVRDVIKSCPITVMNEPRPGKGLLVLDLDYTMVDTKPLLAQALPAAECARPWMHDFLEMAYRDYDIVIWSQTHWMWLETKLSELGVIGRETNYKICFIVDRKPMFPIFSLMSDGREHKHEVKPLEYLWAKFPQWSAKNTVHIDDLSRNFAMNPGEGLKIRAFKGAGTAQGANDREFYKLGPYLRYIAEVCDDFQKLDHANWKRWNRPR